MPHRKTLVDGQFSMPFLAAVMLRQGSFGWSDFERYLPDQGILATCKIVVPVQDDRVEPPVTNNFAATVAITTADGSIHETIVPVPSGEPSVFPSSVRLSCCICVVFVLHLCCICVVFVFVLYCSELGTVFVVGIVQSSSGLNVRPKADRILERLGALCSTKICSIIK